MTCPIVCPSVCLCLSVHLSVSSFREVCAKVAKKNFPDRWNEKRVEFLPVEWRTSLSLDEGNFTM